MSLRDLFHRAGSIDVAEAARLVDSGELVLIDVRESAEWRAGRAPGARHVPLSGLARSVDAIAREETQVAFICRSGHRSGAACAAARSRGLDAVNVPGGMIAWQRAGLSVTKG